MRRTAEWTRRLTALAAVVLIPGLWACSSEPAGPAEVQTRIFRVTEAGGQLLPADHTCPAPEEGVTAGARFLEGELILYPERTFSWRYTVEHYATAPGGEETWTEPVRTRGTYVRRGESLELATEAGLTRSGTIRGETVELTEPLPCQFSVEGHTPPGTILQLDEVEPAR